MLLITFGDNPDFYLSYILCISSYRYGSASAASDTCAFII